MSTLRALTMVAILAFPTLARGYEVSPVTDGGSVTGRVTFEGAVPAPKRMLISKNKDVCGEGHREIVDVAVRNGGLKNAVIVIDGITKGKAWAPTQQQPLLDQKGCRFVPPMLVVQKRGRLQVLNSDPVLHNVHAYEIIGRARRTMFNFGQPNQGQKQGKKIKVRRGEWIKLECDAHDFMHAWMFAAKSPYFGVTGQDGSFVITDIPPGTYRVRALHPVLGMMKGEVTVQAKRKAVVKFEFSR